MVAIVTMLCLYHKLRKRKRQLEKIAEVTNLNSLTLYVCVSICNTVVVSATYLASFPGQI